ncbi:unnamed protein product, partial [Ranitomeya imitator]
YYFFLLLRSSDIYFAGVVWVKRCYDHNRWCGAVYPSLLLVRYAGDAVYPCLCAILLVRYAGGAVYPSLLLVRYAGGAAWRYAGVLYKDECPLNPLIPIYLIVSGASYLLTILLLPLKNCCRQLCAVLEGFLLIFIICWLIAGSFWVFSIHLVYPFLCNTVLFQFSFGVLVFQYIYVVIVSVTLVLVICFTGFKVSYLHSFSRGCPLPYNIPPSVQTAQDKHICHCLLLYCTRTSRNTVTLM